jgi:hypothetical protein
MEIPGLYQLTYMHVEACMQASIKVEPELSNESQTLVLLYTQTIGEAPHQHLSNNLVQH